MTCNAYISVCVLVRVCVWLCGVLQYDDVQEMCVCVHAHCAQLFVDFSILFSNLIKSGQCGCMYQYLHVYCT